MGIFTKSNQYTEEEKNLIKKVEILTQAVERVYPSTAKLIYRNFLSGVFFSLGTTIGLSIVIALVTFFVTQLSHVPVVSDIIERTSIEKILPKPSTTPTPTPSTTPTPSPISTSSPIPTSSPE